MPVGTIQLKYFQSMGKINTHGTGFMGGFHCKKMCEEC